MAKRYTVSVVGSGGVGKSSLTLQMVHNHFVEEYDPTIEDTYRKELRIDGKLTVIDIFDTAHQEECLPYREEWLKKGDGFLLVYSITTDYSLERAADFRSKIVEGKGTPTFPMTLVGNKVDLAASRQVDTADAKRFADEWDVPFVEISAKSIPSVTEVFTSLVKRIHTFHNRELFPLTNTNQTASSKPGLLTCTLL